MRWFGFLTGSTAIVAVLVASGALAQQRSDSDDARKSQEKEKTSQGSSQGQRRDTLGDNEVRLRYDDDDDRLHIDVDEEYQFRNDKGDGQDRGWARDGAFDLQYDADRNDLELQGEGTIDVDRVGAAVAHWWQTWWERERQQRRSKEQGVESGARTFIKQYDDDEDGFVSRSELPSSMRDRMEEIDSNGDNHLSYREIRSLGAGFHQDRARSTRDRQQSTANRSDNSTDRADREYASSRGQDDESWSQWWSSWWSDEDQSSDGAQGGAQRLLRQYDDNNSGNLSRTELPIRMRADFDSVDRNDDNYLSLSELRQHGDQLRDNDRRTVGRVDSSRSETSSRDEETWNQWWNSWFEDNADDEPRNMISMGAREFIRRHDENDDGYLVRSELPDRMYDDFSRIDRNDDRYLTRSEIERFVEENNQQHGQRSTVNQTSSRGQSQNSQSQQRRPVQAVAFWVVDVDKGQLELDDLQKAYDQLRKIDADSNGTITRSELREYGDDGRAGGSSR